MRPSASANTRSRATFAASRAGASVTVAGACRDQHHEPRSDGSQPLAADLHGRLGHAL